MRLHEDFSRCDCGNAYFKKEEYVLTRFEKHKNNKVINLMELPERREIRYSCGKCNTVIFTKRE